MLNLISSRILLQRGFYSRPASCIYIDEIIDNTLLIFIKNGSVESLDVVSGC